MLRHAASRTWASLGGWTLFWTILAIPAVGFALHFWLAGKKAMSAELSIWLIYGLAATGLVAIALFSWNLACAPYRIARDTLVAASHERNEAVRDLDAARSEIPPSFRLADNVIRRDGFAIGEASGRIALNGQILSMEGVTLSAKLNKGDKCVFQNFVAAYDSADAEFEATIASRVERSLRNAKFSVVDVWPVYVQAPKA